ncbi:PRC-barrel domain-containing protein [Nocardia sp. NPDC050793]|uniref:PRC-barrel domain-containing protein n=1 Tax=Nocardia sp. NPDC050793 TaxID=3155159 RepID=UPI003409361D
MSSLLDSVLGNIVYDRDGDKVGKVKRIYVDNASGFPTWVAISTGLFGHDALVPLAGAEHRRERATLQVRVGKEQVKSAPYLDDDGNISQRSERELFEHYDIDPALSAWKTYGRPYGEHPVNARATTAEWAADSGGRTDDELIRSEERLNIGADPALARTARGRGYVDDEPTVAMSTGRDASAPAEPVQLEIDDVLEEQTGSDRVRTERVDGIDETRGPDRW